MTEIQEIKTFKQKCESIDLSKYKMCTTKSNDIISIHDLSYSSKVKGEDDRSRGEITCSSGRVIPCSGIAFEYKSTNKSDFIKYFRTIVPVNKDTFLFESTNKISLRTYFEDKEWMISTSKMINGWSSRWNGSTDLGTKYENELSKMGLTTDLFHECLNKNYVYEFQYVPSIENGDYTTARAKQSKIVHVGTFDQNNKFLLFDEIKLHNNEIFPKLKLIKRLAAVMNPEEVFELRNSTGPESDGVIIITEDNSRCNILSDKASEMVELRQNCPINKLLFSNNIMNNDLEKEKTIKDFYKEQVDEYNEYKKFFNNKINKLVGNYNTRYCKGEFLTLSKQDHFIVNTVFISERDNRYEEKGMIKEKIIGVVNGMDSRSKLFFMS